MPSALRKNSDEKAFLRRFLDDPKRTGAVAPSGPFLAREMARAVDPHASGLVVELGPGTGPVTKALIAHGVPRERLLMVEYDPHFCAMLSDRYGASHVVQGDAYALGRTLQGRLTQPVAAIVSSLPLLNEKPERRLQLLDEAFALMGGDGLFVQFTYGFKAPIPRELLAGRYFARSGPPVLRNLPPASVWTFRLSPHGPERKVLKLKDHAERVRAEFAARRRATEALLERQGDKVLELIADAERLGEKLAARRKATEALIGRKSDEVIERLKREVASLRLPRRDDER